MISRITPARGRWHRHRAARTARVPTRTVPPSRPGTQRGQALVAALLALTLLAAGGLLAGGELRARAHALAHARSVEALATARTALIGYAISYAETHPGEGYGFLPCPDAGNTGSTPIGACGARGMAAIGRLPWRTLGLPELRDGWGECLWYAVAGSVKHNPKPAALNWDSPGQFSLLDAAGRSLQAAGGDGMAVAVVFSPGPPRNGQTRPSTRGTSCTGSDSAAADLSHYLDAGHVRAGSGAIEITLHPATLDDEAPNDLATWIGIDDVFDALRRRRDHARHLDELLARSTDALAGRLAASRDDWLRRHARPVGALAVGVLPSAETLGIAAAQRPLIDDWHEQIHFAACPDGSACIGVIRPAAPGERCRAVLAFGGERLRSGPGRQLRTTASERAEPAAWFEGRNVAALRLGVPEFEGAEHFRVAAPERPATEDVIRCLP
ncbi:MAG: hypothetical protein KUL79_08595 [Thauera sp.]|nr:hypothetical protein [Thauera sp.]